MSPVARARLPEKDSLELAGCSHAIRRSFYPIALSPKENRRSPLGQLAAVPKSLSKVAGGLGGLLPRFTSPDRKLLIFVAIADLRHSEARFKWEGRDGDEGPDSTTAVHGTSTTPQHHSPSPLGKEDAHTTGSVTQEDVEDSDGVSRVSTDDERDYGEHGYPLDENGRIIPVAKGDTDYFTVKEMRRRAWETLLRGEEYTPAAYARHPRLKHAMKWAEETLRKYEELHGPVNLDNGPVNLPMPSRRELGRLT
ncbi:unnamed protein product [Cuscuta campestris]|uniref:Uncharacterized protein n=1 Tax=Cuscuta campestris TaxID=132261 RepID=A0A484LT65_9ASTE|nr:unnamed protein product [Cuscuta campestris]